MRKKTISVPMTGAVNTRIDPKLAVLPSIQRADNVYRARTGEWAQRPGFDILPNTVDSFGGFTIDVVRKLAARAKELVVVSTKRFWSWSSARQTFVDLSYGAGANDLSVCTHELLLFDDAAPFGTSAPPNTDESDIAFGSGYVCSTWAFQANTGSFQVVFTVSELSTGQRRRSPTSVPKGNVNGRNPRVVFASGKFFIFFMDEDVAASDILVAVFDPASDAAVGGITTTVVAADAMGTGTGTAWYDVYVRPDNGRILVAYRSSASTLKALEWNGATNAVSIAAVTVVASDVASAGLGWIDTGTSGTTSPRLLTAVNGATGVVRRVLNGATLAQTASTTLQASPGDVSAVTGVYDGTNDTVFWQVEHASDVELTQVKQWNTALGFTSEFCNAGALASKACFVTPTGAAGASVYVVLRQPWKFQGTYFVASGYQDNAAAPATVARILRGRTPHTPPRRNTLSNATKLSETRIGFAGRVIYDATSTVATDVLIARPAAVFVEFSGRMPEPVQFGDQLFFPGSMPRSYGGQKVAETGFQVDPTTMGVVASVGGLLSAGVYQYTSLFVHQDNEGRIWRSGPGPVSQVTAAANDKVTITSKHPFVFHRVVGTGGGTVWKEIYRTRANGTQFFRNPLTATPQLVLNSSQTVTIVDDLADADLERNIPLYVDGGELFNSPPPACLGAVVQGDRIVVIDAERPSRVAASKEMQPGQGTGWHADLAVDVEADGPNTALALIEGRIVVFKRQAIYVLTGDWPDANGQGSLPVPQKIATGFGTTEPESICQTTDGVWFKDPKKGLCFIDRGLQVTQPGKPMQVNDGNDVVAATIVESGEQVRFLTASGFAPIYDYFEKQWMSMFGDGSISSRTAAALVDGLYYIAAANRVYVQNPNNYADSAALGGGGGGTYFADIGMRITLAGLEGVQRIHRITLMGSYFSAAKPSFRLTDDYSNTALISEVKLVPEGVQDAAPAQALTPLHWALTLRPKNQRTTSVGLQMFWLSSGNSGAGIRLTSISIEVGLRDTPGLRRLPARHQR